SRFNIDTTGFRLAYPIPRMSRVKSLRASSKQDRMLANRKHKRVLTALKVHHRLKARVSVRQRKLLTLATEILKGTNCENIACFYNAEPPIHRERQRKPLLVIVW